MPRATKGRRTHEVAAPAKPSLAAPELGVPEGHHHGLEPQGRRSVLAGTASRVGTGALSGAGASLLLEAFDLDKLAHHGVVGLIVACVVAVAAIAGAAFTAWARAKYD